MARWIFVAVIVAVGLVLFNMWNTFDSDSIRGKRVLITGASSGIGEELAYQYSQLGASVVITARRADLLQKVASKCKQLGAKKVEYVVADMAKPEDRLKVVSDTEKHLGGLDQLILNHALLKGAALWLGSTQNFTLLNQQLQINFVAFVDLASKCLKMLTVSHGNIGVVSSLYGKIPAPYFGSYSADKFALHGFFSAFRQELSIRKLDVSVTLCVLGLIGTEAVIDMVQERSGWVVNQPATVEETAVAIMKGVTERCYEIYVPKSIRFYIFVHKFFTGYVEDFMTKMFYS